MPDENHLQENVTPHLPVPETKPSGHPHIFSCFMIILIFLLLCITTYLVFMPRKVDLEIKYPNQDKSVFHEPCFINFFDSKKTILLQDYEQNIGQYERNIEIKRYDVYGDDPIKDNEYTILDQNQKTVASQKLMPGLYTLKIQKEGFKPIAIPLTVNKFDLLVPIQLEPLTEQKSTLRIYIYDPLLDENFEPDSVTLLHTNKDIQKTKIKSGIYAVKIEKAGYQPKELELFISENGMIKEKITLEYAKRSVKIIINDGLNKKGYEPEIAGHEIKLFQDGQKIPFTNTLLPGYYDLDVDRDGYYPYKSRIKILPGNEIDVLSIPLQPRERSIVVFPNYDIVPTHLKPDRAYLTDLNSANKDVIPITDGLRVSPGEYCVKVEKANYRPYMAKLQITPSSSPYIIQAQLISIMRTFFLKITSDYEIEPNITPDELFIDMRITKSGYAPIEWGNIQGTLENATKFPITSIPTEKKEVEVPIYLTTLPRRVILQLVAKPDYVSIGADSANLSRMSDGQPVGEPIDLTKDNVAVKPGRYILEICKKSYETIREEVIIEPNITPYIVKYNLIAKKR